MVDAQFYPDWDAVYRDNATRVYRLMYSKVGNRADAEDLTAEVFTAALRPLRVSASAPEVRAYLFATARTVLAGHWRRHYGREVTLLAEMSELPDPGTGDGGSPDPSAATISRAADMLAGLPEKYSQVLRLRFLQGYSIRDTASELGISVANAKVVQHRALRRAAQLIEEASP